MSAAQAEFIEALERRLQAVEHRIASIEARAAMTEMRAATLGVWPMSPFAHQYVYPQNSHF